MLVNLTAITSLLAFLSGCVGYVPGRQSYWDGRVKELCEKDGGVTVYERITLAQKEYRLLRGPGGNVVVPWHKFAGPDAPYIRKTDQTSIRSGDPEVFRLETRIIRTADRKVLSRSVTYIRRGGDIPSPAHPSSFGCSDIGFRADVEQQTFVIPEADG